MFLYFPASLLIVERKLKGVSAFPDCLFSLSPSTSVLLKCCRMINFSKQGSKLCCSWTDPRLLSLSVLSPYIPARERRGDRTHRAAIPLPGEVGKGCERGWEQPPCSATSEICRGAVCHPRPPSCCFFAALPCPEGLSSVRIAPLPPMGARPLPCPGASLPLMSR